MNPSVFDVAVIGGGVVGCAVFRRFCLMGAKSVLLEKGGDILSGASKANSALLHTGFDAPPGSLELECMRAGYREFFELKDKLPLPVLQSGAFVVAWTEEQLAALPGIVGQAHRNGVMDVAQVEAGVLYRHEPALGAGALGAVQVPGESIIDAWTAPLAYFLQGLKHGGAHRFRCEVRGASFDGSAWSLQSTRGEIRARLVINCAGLQGDIVDGFWHEPGFQIKPRKGQFLIFDKPASKLLNAIILPVPTPTTKGVLLTRTIFGNLLLGPTAEEQEDRERAEVAGPQLNDLIEKGRRILPRLADYSVTATYAGLRTATEKKEYRISHYPDKQWITVGGIRSTGLTSALGIAQYLEKTYDEAFAPLFPRRPMPELIRPELPRLSEYSTRDYARAGNGGIICHCERVTLRDIRSALDSDAPPECLGGLRRRSRVLMGRCNGFFCSHRVAEIVGDRFDDAPAPRETGAGKTGAGKNEAGTPEERAPGRQPAHVPPAESQEEWPPPVPLEGRPPRRPFFGEPAAVPARPSRLSA